jgi:hypothetical protein
VSREATALVCIVCVKRRPALQCHTVSPRTSSTTKSCVRASGKSSSTVLAVLFITRSAKFTWLPARMTSSVVATTP